MTIRKFVKASELKPNDKIAEPSDPTLIYTVETLTVGTNMVAVVGYTIDVRRKIVRFYGIDSEIFVYSRPDFD